MMQLNKTVLRKNDLVIIKVGTEEIIINQFDSRINTLALREIAQIATTLLENGVRVVLVSSGAIACGKDEINSFLRTNLIKTGAASTIGQHRLMYAWEQAFSIVGNAKIAQCLLEHRDLKHPDVIIPKFREIIRAGIVPICNTNDLTTNEELRGGDNDFLGLGLSLALNAKLWIVLTKVGGYLDENNNIVSNINSRDIIEAIKLCKGKSHNGTGGMARKLTYASQAISVINGDKYTKVLLCNRENLVKAISENRSRIYLDPQKYTFIQR